MIDFRRSSRMRHRTAIEAVHISFLLIACCVVGDSLTAQETGEATTRFVDCSLLIASEYPATWPTYPFPRFQLIHEQAIGADSAYNIDVLLIDGNTGTQLDVPPHSVMRPDLNREKSGPFGLAYTDKIEAWQFGGEACIIDVRDLLDKAPNGVSPLVLPFRHLLSPFSGGAAIYRRCRGS